MSRATREKKQLIPAGALGKKPICKNCGGELDDGYCERCQHTKVVSFNRQRESFKQSAGETYKPGGAA